MVEENYVVSFFSFYFFFQAFPWFIMSWVLDHVPSSGNQFLFFSIMKHMNVRDLKTTTSSQFFGFFLRWIKTDFSFQLANRTLFVFGPLRQRAASLSRHDLFYVYLENVKLVKELLLVLFLFFCILRLSPPHLPRPLSLYSFSKYIPGNVPWKFELSWTSRIGSWKFLRNVPVFFLLESTRRNDYSGPAVR